MDFLDITCPTCWQSFEIELPPYNPQGVELVTDCEICCRPMQVRLDWLSEQEAPEVSVESES